ncbi:MAG TPA: FKBP-type peptidyl-prolyl cis-trans isomerase [Povalibacter sp.]|nr:FKBP-type peptidyl-prolyl cis-trans isomerase [Povalibacter sp.]
MYRVGLLILALGVLAACKPATPPPAPPAAAAEDAAIDQLLINEVAIGTGDPIGNGQTAVVHYTGWLYDPAAPDHKGTKFDSSRDKGQPFRFVVGGGKVIQGWDQGVLGMSVGGQRELVVPSRLAYGEAGAGGVIPPGATLLFDVELLAIEPAR